MDSGTIILTGAAESRADPRGGGVERAAFPSVAIEHRGLLVITFRLGKIDLLALDHQ